MCSCTAIQGQSRFSIVGICPAFTWALGSPPSHVGAGKCALGEDLCSVVLPRTLRGGGGAEGFKGACVLPPFHRRESGMG